MTFQYWLSPFQISASVQQLLNDAGLQQLSWNQHAKSRYEKSLILFNTPEQLIAHLDGANSSIAQSHPWNSELQTLMAEVIDRLRSRPNWSLVAAWQLERMSQTVSLKDIFALDSDALTLQREHNGHYPDMSTVSALLIHHINQKSGGKLIELYVEMDELAVKFGRTTDSHYIERLNKGIESSNALTEIRLIAEQQQREEFLLKNLHQTQQDYRNYYVDSQKIIQRYQNLLDESQSIAARYREQLTQQNDKTSK